MKINRFLFENSANLISMVRIFLVFVIILLFNSPVLTFKILGLIFLFIIVWLDWLDGYLARRLNISSNIGGLLDTLSDRITENLFLVFFAYRRLIPIWVPLIFIARSFCADFIRYLNFSEGIGTFAINKSKLGFYIVASKTSRVIYLLCKFFIFYLGAILIIMQDLNVESQKQIFIVLKYILLYSSIFLVILNLMRFIFLIYDSRFILKKKLIKEI